jgi:hypothetical protein
MLPTETSALLTRPTTASSFLGGLELGREGVCSPALESPATHDDIAVISDFPTLCCSQIEICTLQYSINEYCTVYGTVIGIIVQ